MKNQRYCGARDCQQARKNAWQREKQQTDPDYRSTYNAEINSPISAEINSTIHPQCKMMVHIPLPRQTYMNSTLPRGRDACLCVSLAKKEVYSPFSLR